MMQVETRYTRVQIETGARVSMVEAEHGRITVEPCIERGTGVPLACINVTTESASRAGRCVMEMDKEGAVELVRRLTLHFGL